jgi:hypothetical protein
MFEGVCPCPHLRVKEIVSVVAMSMSAQVIVALFLDLV